MSTPTQDPHAADPEGQSTTTAGSCALSATHQLALQLFARVDTFAGVPPEHALFRELLDLALPAVGDGILVGTRIVTANALYSVACAIYFRVPTRFVRKYTLSAKASALERPRRRRRPWQGTSRTDTI